MVAYLKPSGNEKTYSNYLLVAWEAEKEVMEASHNPPMASTSKPKVMSFFPLWKLKGSQPAASPSAWVTHLEEESTDKEEYINGKDPDGIKGITREFIVHLTRAVKDAQQAEKHCYHCGSPDHFIGNCPLVVGSRADLPLNWREGQHRRREPESSRKGDHTEGGPGWDTSGVKFQTQTPFLNPNPFNQWYGIKNVARVRVSGESCMAPLDNGTQINTMMLGFIENHSLDVVPLRLHRQMSHLCRPGKHPYSTHWLCHHTGSSRWSLGLWWGSDSPYSPWHV